MRRIITALIALTVLPAVMVVAAAAPEAHAFCSIRDVPFVPDYCPHEGHSSITSDALGFLDPGLVRWVSPANENQDSGAQVISNIGHDSRARTQLVGGHHDIP